MSQFCNCEYGDILLLAFGEAPLYEIPKKKKKKQRKKKERKKTRRKKRLEKL
jgi:hypothetical protein